MATRKRYIETVSRDSTSASYVTSPPTQRPFKVRGTTMGKIGSTETVVSISFTKEQAQKVVNDWISFGLFGRHGRVETSAK